MNAHSSGGTLMPNLPLMCFFSFFIFILWPTYWFLTILLVYVLSIKSTKAYKFKSELRPPRLHFTIPGCSGCSVATPSLPLPQCYCSLDDKAHVPPYSASWWGVGGLFVWLPLSQTHAPIWRTHVLSKEKGSGGGGGGATAGHYSRRWWRWKDETRWPSVVRVCNL